MVAVTVKRVTGGAGVPVELETGDGVRELRARAARALGVGAGEAGRVKLVLRGSALVDGQPDPGLRDGDVVLAAVAPKPPPVERRRELDGGFDEMLADDFRLDLAQLSERQQRVARFLKFRVGLPDPLVKLALAFGARNWALALAGLVLAPRVAGSGYEHSFVLAICVLFILCNLGTRGEGEASACVPTLPHTTCPRLTTPLQVHGLQ